jgi:hypothetical protein
MRTIEQLDSFHLTGSDGLQVQAHTPGPWTTSAVSADDGSIGITKDNYYIAQVTNAASFGDYLGAAMRGRENTADATRTQWANARLIAAAPDLLAALRPFANYACDVPCDCNNCAARAAIATATGEAA